MTASVIAKIGLLAVFALLWPQQTYAVGSEEVDFSRDVRPILSDHCYACHGPDSENRAADLRLDNAEGLSYVVDLDSPRDSDLIWRVENDDAEFVMPPPEYHKPLSKEQKETLVRWIESGAQFEGHWAFDGPTAQPPKAKAVLDIQRDASDALATASRIDQYVNASLREMSLEPNARADRSSILRRVCLDLTGLPPSDDLIAAFASDQPSMTFEQVVDQLLASKHFGEHVGRYWLDLVRYADTHGLHLDNYREMWPFRDWVIEAFNADMPFDEFITKQLAGDLLPDATLEDRIASGFNRLNVTTNEGGSIYDEVFARNCIDRTDAFGTVFLGLTTQCAVCHDHKFDPITQKDYYSLLAFFNSLDGRALDGNVKDHQPSVRVASEEQQKQLKELQSQIAEMEATMDQPIDSVDEAQRFWERTLAEDPQPPTRLQISSFVTENKSDAEIQDDGSLALGDQVSNKETVTLQAILPNAVTWQTLSLRADLGKDEKVGTADNGNAVLSEIEVFYRDQTTEGQWAAVALLDAFASHQQSENKDFEVTNAIDGKIDDAKGWAVGGHQVPGPRDAFFGLSALRSDDPEAEIQVRLHYQSRYPKHAFRRVTLALQSTPPLLPPKQRVRLGETHLVGPFPVENTGAAFYRSFASQKGAFKADEAFQYRGREYRWQHHGNLPQVAVSDVPYLKSSDSAVLMHRSIQSPDKRDLPLLWGCDHGYVMYLNGKEVARREGTDAISPLGREINLSLKKGHNDLYIKLISPARPQRIAYAFRSPAIELPKSIIELASESSEERLPETRESLRRFYRNVVCVHPDWTSLVAMRRGMISHRKKVNDSIPTTLVWKEAEKPRDAFILNRGQYDDPGEKVVRDVPGFLPPLPEGARKDRLGLANWLTSPNHPLTARVAVNRIWQQLFGNGLVKTSEDFGNQGEAPSHPELLDYLALRFQESGWQVKDLYRAIVLSKTYRRDASVSERMLAVDPENRFFAHGPRHRLDAEVLRDQALALSGLLIDQSGGKSVKPPQPAGLWKAVGYSGSNTVNFRADSGDAIYRRSVYVFWKRTAPPPQMSTLDAPSRESCTARRERTNTPLQALLLMNEAQYLEAAISLVDQFFVEGSSPAEVLRQMFVRCTASEPSEPQRAELASLALDLASYYQSHPDLAEKLSGQSDATRAALVVVASTLLNLDEVVNK
ncbi:MAG: PSD1 and planctomycete cytochrome C domain-containing protein [Planctomycetota bacterium]